MVCIRQISQQSTKLTNQNEANNADSTGSVLSGTAAKLPVLNETDTMEYDDNDPLQLQHLAGYNIVTHDPLYSLDGEFLFIRTKQLVQLYSTSTGELARQLTGANSKLISMELELRDADILVACSCTGEVLRWNWRTGRLLNTLDLKLQQDQQVLTFNLLNFYGNSKTACGFLTMRCAQEETVQWMVVDTSVGIKVKVACNLKLLNDDPLVAVHKKSFKIIAIAQGSYIYFLNYKSWYWKRLFNANRVPITVVRAHPVEEMIATGDELGKIFLWREFMSQNTVKTTLYHWHHTAVTSIAFTPSGTGFFSSGLESVLVKWNVKRPDLRNFLPRMSAIIQHIVVSDNNTQLAICTADNGVQFIGTDQKIISTLHEFTFVAEDKTGLCKFPIGLRLNPRTNTLVLNGRVGHLQFYSVYTKSLLYNMDIVMQNPLSMETDKILYNIRVTKAAFNIDWMATCEEFNDGEHFPELRLKFWKYQPETQTYTLNTNVELPHEDGFRAIEFSNEYQVDNLLCATVGADDVIKIWSLEESDNIYKKGKVWYCIAKTKYRNMSVESISFSQDGSLLAAGYGNTLCVYKADNLKLKVALSAPPGYDGCIPKLEMNICDPNTDKETLKKTIEKRKHILQLYKNFVENNDRALIKELEKSADGERNVPTMSDEEEAPIELDSKTKEKLFQQIMDMHQLNLFHKILIFQKLGIYCEVHPQLQSRMIQYLRDTVLPEGLRERRHKMHDLVERMSIRKRFKAKYRLSEYERQLRVYDKEVQKNLIPIMSLLNLNETSKETKLTNGDNDEEKDTIDACSDPPILTEDKLPLPPATSRAQISHVQFAAGEFAHLVIVCTERRILIWNMLTLRLQAVLKLSVEHLAFDAQSNLVAAFTKYNELYVFQPNVPLTIYQRRNLPSLYGAVWLPRRYPKQRSINVDWQAQSTLYFLTKEQELMYLATAASSEIDEPPPIKLTEITATDALRYTTFGTLAAQQHSDMNTNIRQPIGPLVTANSTQSAVKLLIDMSTHTMPPLSLFCNNFVKSLVKSADSASQAAGGESAGKPTKPLYRRTKALNGRDFGGLVNGNALHTDEDDDDDVDDVDGSKDDIDETMQATTSKTALKTRKELLTKAAEISRNSNVGIVETLQAKAEAQLQRIAKQNIDIEF